jgi:hypothetical protein
MGQKRPLFANKRANDIASLPGRALLRFSVLPRLRPCRDELCCAFRCYRGCVPAGTSFVALFGATEVASLPGRDICRPIESILQSNQSNQSSNRINRINPPIESIETIESIESIETIESIESIETIEQSKQSNNRINRTIEQSNQSNQSSNRTIRPASCCASRSICTFRFTLRSP